MKRHLKNLVMKLMEKHQVKRKRTFDDNLPPLNQEIENSKPTSEELHRRPTDYDDSIPKPDPTPYHNEKKCVNL